MRELAYLAKCECELVFVGVINPEFDAGYPVQERDDDHGDEVNEWEVFAHNCPDVPCLSAPIKFSDAGNTYKVFQKLKR